MTKSKQPTDYNAILSVFQAIATVLAVRAFILLAVLGSFILGVLAIPEKDTHSLWALGIFAGFSILPLVWLDIQTRGK